MGLHRAKPEMGDGKWAIVFTPTKQRGLGLRDPQHSNTLMGARIWWQWVSSPHKPWAQLWTAKYENNFPQEEFIKITTTDTGSLIWNAAK